MNPPRILIAGIGNIFLGDDAFGSAVAQQMLQKSYPPHVTVADFGIRGLDLAYALADGYDVAILIDAAPRGNHPPGTLYVLEPTLGLPGEADVSLDAHSMNPMKILQAAAALGNMPSQIFIVGCEPTHISEDQDDFAQDMTPPVKQAVEQAALLVEQVLTQCVSDATVRMQKPRLQEAT